MQRAGVVLVLGLVGCSSAYQPATLSTLAPDSRVTLRDSSRVNLKLPEVRQDSLYSQQHGPIPVDSISRVETRKAEGASAGQIIGIVAGVFIGAAIAQEIK